MTTKEPFEAPVWYWRWVSLVAPTWRREIAYWLVLIVLGFVLGWWSHP